MAPVLCVFFPPSFSQSLLSLNLSPSVCLSMTLSLSHTHTHSWEKDTVSQVCPAPSCIYSIVTNLSSVSYTASHCITHALPPCHTGHLSVTPPQMTPLSKQTHTRSPSHRDTFYLAVSHKCCHGLTNKLCSTQNLPQCHSHVVSQNATQSLAISHSL